MPVLILSENSWLEDRLKGLGVGLDDYLSKPIDKRDPIDREGGLYSYLWTITPFQNIVKGHMRLIEKYPHRVSETMPKGAALTPHD